MSNHINHLITIVPNNYTMKLRNIYGISVNLDNCLPLKIDNNTATMFLIKTLELEFRYNNSLYAL